MDYVSDYIFDGLHLLVAEDGSVSTTDNKPVLQLANGKFWVNNHAHVIKGANDLETRYLYYALSATHITPYITGAVQLKLTQENLNNIEISYPEREEQRIRIAEFLGAFDDKIEMNNKIIKNLEELARAIFKEWFVKFHFPGHEKVKMVDSELDKIPEGWEVRKVADLGRVVTGKTPPSMDPDNFGGECQFVTIPDMSGAFVVKSERSISSDTAMKMKNLLLPAGSISVSCIATVGLVSILTKDSITNQQVNSLVPELPQYRYLFYWNMKGRRKELESHGGGGTSAMIINKTRFENLPILVPSEVLLNKFHELMSPLMDKYKSCLLENEKLAQARDLFLPKVMKGEVEV